MLALYESSWTSVCFLYIDLGLKPNNIIVRENYVFEKSTNCEGQGVRCILHKVNRESQMETQNKSKQLRWTGPSWLLTQVAFVHTWYLPQKLWRTNFAMWINFRLNLKIVPFSGKYYKIVHFSIGTFCVGNNWAKICLWGKHDKWKCVFFVFFLLHINNLLDRLATMQLPLDFVTHALWGRSWQDGSI